MKTVWLVLLTFCCSAASAAEWSVSRAHERWIHSIAFSPDGKWIATGSDDQAVKVWDAATGKELWNEATANAITAVVWSQGGKQLLAGNWRGGIEVRDAQSGKLLTQWKAHRENITGLAASQDGLQLATASGDDSCKVWDLATRRCLLTIVQDNEYDATCVAFSPNGKFVVVGDGENLLKLYGVRSGELLLTFSGHTETIAAVAFSRDGKRVFSASSDDTVRIWDAATGGEIRKLEGHADDITSLARSCDGLRLVSGSADGSAIVWDAASGKKQAEFSGFSHGVTAVAISADGRRVASGSRQELRIKEAAR